MKKSLVLSTAAIALSIAAAPAANAAHIVNVDVDGVANSSMNGSNAVSVLLNAGTYNLSFIQGAYTAFTRFNGVSGCDSSGANCRTGFENSVRYVINGTTFGFGDGNGNGGLGPLGLGDGYYADAATSFANSGMFNGSFTLASATSVDFYLFDDNISDNSGGVSLSVAAVPEPGAWALMLAGFGAMGGAMRRKGKTGLRFKFA